MELRISLTERIRTRTLANGLRTQQRRFVLNYVEPVSAKRRQEFFTLKKDAEARQRDLIMQAATDTYVDERAVPTISGAIDHWIENKTGKVKANTLKGYKAVIERVRGPLLVGTERERAAFTEHGIKPKNARFLPMLGSFKLTDLRTGDIRKWHGQLTEQCGAYTANRAKSLLQSVLALAEEDFGIRSPAMPTQLGAKRQRVRKSILTPEHIARLIEAAQADPEHGLYYAFPFLAGTRPSEQLGLLWEDVNFERNVIHIRRIQERDGSLTLMTKTEAGTRDVPMGATLRSMLMAWKLRCPRRKTELHRVFPGPGRLQPWPLPRLGGGGPLLYQNYRKRYWCPIFKRLGIPYVTPHSARHSFISTLQAQGIEVGLVAKIAGHANPTVTLGHYTQAVRGIDVAAEALERAYATR